MIKEFSHLRYHVVDTLFTNRVHAASIYAMISKTNDCAIWDTGTPRNFNQLKKSLADIGVTKNNLTKVVLSHVHLDHAGNTANFAREFPNAKIYVHPNGFKHISKPDILVREAKKVMQYDYYKEYCDQILPVDPERIFKVEDNYTLKFDGGASVQLIHAPGHCFHHLAWIDTKAKIALTGDVFGNSFDDIAKNIYFPVTSPAAFDPDSWLNTMKKILSKGIETIGVAHYGFHDNAQYQYDCVTRWIKKMKEIAIKEKEEDIPSAVANEYIRVFSKQKYEADPMIQMNYKTGLIGVIVYHRMVKAKKIIPAP